MTVTIERRKFNTLLCGVAATWPRAARAQQPGRLPTIGFLDSTTSLAASQWVAAFVQGLRQECHCFPSSGDYGRYQWV
jgi:hypothetical protein